MNFLRRIWDIINGSKTYVVALAGFIYGLSQGNVEIVLAALATAGLRHGISK